MRNLDLWEVSSRNLNFNSDKDITVCCGREDDNGFGEFYICSHNLIASKSVKDGTINWKKDISSTNSSPVNVTFLILPNLLCLGLENGEIYNIDKSGLNMNLVGKCDDGVLAMEWSPDQELLVVVTKKLNAILMSYKFDPIHETNLLIEEFGEQEFVTVGWGKKETQFHGSEGKQAAKVKNEVTADPLNNCDETVKISFRGDGNVYAIGFTMNGIRRFKVFDSMNGNLLYTSEKQQGLDANLSWRPSGNVIATIQKLSDKHVVAFFEKNGLKHGEFNIPVNSTTIVEDIAWSTDSEVLALQCKDTETKSQIVLLFTISNYHWYLKQTLEFNDKQIISKILWDNDFDVVNNKKLHIFLQNGQHMSYSWIWSIDHSRGKSGDDDAVVAVIDGKKILLTGFRQTVIPPPMAAFEIELNSFVNSVHFAPHKQNSRNIDSNTFFICTADNKLIFYRQIQKFPLQYEEFKTIKLDQYNFPFQNYNWYWINDDTIVCTALNNDECYQLEEYKLSSNELIRQNIESMPAEVSRIQCHPTDSSSIFLQLRHGDIVQYIAGGNLEPQDVAFNIPCAKFSVLSINGDLYFIGLSHKGHFYVNNTMIMNNVSSFYVHTHFLLITTLRHVLLSAELTKSGLDAIVDYQKNECVQIYKRKIERGAKLVLAVPNNTRTIFQMPRGNLETIQPRPLSLKIIREYLDCFEYYKAFDLMLKQRINLNLLYDHDPQKFLSNMSIFLETVTNNTWLSLFLSDLENVDVTKTMYSSSYPEEKKQVHYNETKVQTICNMFRALVDKGPDRDNKILPLLTSYVKTNTSEDLEIALNIIKELKSREAHGSKLPVGSDEALKYLLYMVEVNKLFDAALGMYDFDLVLLVANKSQKDPKEYIPMLNELNGMEECYKRFTINKHLKRYNIAVEYLAKCEVEKHDELRAFVKYHSLYRRALELFSPNDEIYKLICDDFGLYLSLEKYYTEAGIMYERANNLDKAIDCYKDGLEWELAIKVAHVWPKEQFNKLCCDLVIALKEEKRHKEAVTLLEHHCENIDEAINYAIENGQYKTALRLCSQYNKTELKDEHLLPAVLDECEKIQELIRSNWSILGRHIDRLHIVREKNKNKKSEEHYEHFYHRDCDLYSDAGSTIASSASRSSSRTYRSSKNRRKHERKMASLKEGSQYEDVALVMALHSLLPSCFELRLQVREVIVVLTSLLKDSEAFILQSCLDNFLQEMKKTFKDIWTNEFMLEATNSAIAAENVQDGHGAVPQAIFTLEPRMRIAPVIQDINWKLEGLNL